MKLLEYTSKILNLAKVISAWGNALRQIDMDRRARTADYCEGIAATLARAGNAFATLAEQGTPVKTRNQAARDVRRELGRLAGYVEDIAALLDGHLDGRKIAGVKRRLEGLVQRQKIDAVLLETRKAGPVSGIKSRIETLAEAEGYFRALGDRLRT